ncbi:sensor histidine kinase [Oceanobacillus caeni]|uniref:sensor histidine kinase n=1 Tax=Oceanobacillus TaxID=182709 RepID=UPI000621F3A6|nr:sensor histidine kinase [Oceanobacillus caeni]KKE79580.1 histidine kinase [Bacilli bacterium VT-13-104]PZD89710.1 sensor histidine kinase [Bacilli bacterium]MBU8790215.1 sensor histidine kinase [Oceanobacillus caeni]MCR1833454.1 sensor histidine kinase [Oceanobacillus caeni]PZD91232.1 sensor histidine kinase [Bacilli bacterium]
MNIIIRHIFTSVLFSILLSAAIISITFLFFPLKEWMLIWNEKLGSVSYLLWIIGITIVTGIIFGVTIGVYWKQRVYEVERDLDELIKGKKLAMSDDSYREMEQVRHKMYELQEKMKKQVELSQRLATERTEEREKGLQEIVEQERNRLARELHDSVSQQLFASSMMMSAINESNPPSDQKMKDQLRMVEKMIHQSQLEMRALLLHLRPVALKGKTLQEGIEELLRELTQKVPMEITQKIEQFPMDKGVEDQLFRILQESLSNTLRHAKATNLSVLLIVRDETIIFRVVDNGVGFDMESMKTGSYGLQNMRERAYEVGGTFKLVSLPNQGTQLEVKVPILEKVEEQND